MKAVAIIPAGGSGIRCGGKLPKQYKKVAGKEILAYTLQIFEDSKYIDEIIVAVADEYKDVPARLGRKYGFIKPIKSVSGGKERQDSVYNSLSQLLLEEDDLVVVHDSVRPLLPKGILNRAIEVAKEKGTAVVALGMRDTLVREKRGKYDYPDRSNIYSVQTPQIFKFGILLNSFEKALKRGFRGTDESMLVQKAGYEINIVEGALINFKITTEEDIQLMKRIVSSR